VGEEEALERRLLVREMTLGSDRPPEPGVEAQEFVAGIMRGVGEPTG
jgi:hypothetical protein